MPSAQTQTYGSHYRVIAGLVRTSVRHVSCPQKGQLILVNRDGVIWFEQGAQITPVHQIGSDKAGEGEWAGDRLLGGLRQPQQQEGDQRDGDLNSNRVLGGAEKASDFQGLLDPAEEQLDRPPLLVEVGNDLSRGGQIIGSDTQDLASVDPDLDLTNLL